MSTTRPVWIALSLVVGLLWLSFAFCMAAGAIYRGDHPEPLHAIVAICSLAEVFGAPVMAIIMTGSIWVSRGHGEPVPRFALLARNAAWILALIPWLFFVVAVILNHVWRD